ncbi:MAG TPA: type IVB secretion system protein IcmW [Gammaproteobacteria bacterium]|nr:type IVB secretion system protein IcmW [Gammaproteobacteria bacterium]
MPDLSLEATHRFWHDYEDPIIYRVVTFMEGVEEWTLDGNPEFEASMTRLGEALEDIGGIDLQREDDFIKLAAYIKASRNLRLLQCLDTAHPGAASKLLMHAENTSTSSDDVAGLFLRRNIVFERLRLLTRVFSPERFAMVTKVLEDKE